MVIYIAILGSINQRNVFSIPFNKRNSNTPPNLQKKPSILTQATLRSSLIK